MDAVEFHREPPSNVTTLVTAFTGWIDAGEAATMRCGSWSASWRLSRWPPSTWRTSSILPRSDRSCA